MLGAGAAAQARGAGPRRAALAAGAGGRGAEQLPPLERLAAAQRPDIAAITGSFPLRDLLTRSAAFPLIVHRERALYSAWYEFFPRSEGARIDQEGRGKPESGTLRTAAGRLDPIAQMAFAAAYPPPIHPLASTPQNAPA